MRALREHGQLPVRRPEVLHCVVTCLQGIDCLGTEDVHGVVDQIIAASILPSNGPAASPEEEPEGPIEEMQFLAVVRVASRLVDTMRLVESDLMPLLPAEFNVMDRFQRCAQDFIDRYIVKFYDAHKEQLTNEQVDKCLF